MCAQALQLRQAQEQYRQTRQRLKAELQETESALLRGVMPSALALQPPMRVAPVSAPALGNGQVRKRLSSLMHTESAAFTGLPEACVSVSARSRGWTLQFCDGGFIMHVQDAEQVKPQ